ncbi:MAG: hypothetical protein ACK56I_32605, partial [bacterium]
SLQGNRTHSTPKDNLRQVFFLDMFFTLRATLYCYFPLIVLENFSLDRFFSAENLHKSSRLYS